VIRIRTILDSVITLLSQLATKFQSFFIHVCLIAMTPKTVRLPARRSDRICKSTKWLSLAALASFALFIGAVVFDGRISINQSQLGSGVTALEAKVKRQGEQILATKATRYVITDVKEEGEEEEREEEEREEEADVEEQNVEEQNVEEQNIEEQNVEEEREEQEDSADDDMKEERR
jgi:hypothetical protein